MLRLLSTFTLAACLAPYVSAAEPAITVEKDITYAIVEKDRLQLDLVRPVGDGPHPCVVVLHGGAWKYGHRRDVATFAEQLARKGFAAAAVSYRLAPKNKWPAQIEDCKTAVRFLRANAEKYGIDPQRIGAMGFSAGGHLAALLGTTGPDAGFDGTLYDEHSSCVQCVVDFFGPADLCLFCEAPGIEAAYFRPLLGARFQEKPELYKKASPIEHVSKDAPPFLIIHGTADLIVPVIHSERLHEKLTQAGVPSELITVKGVGHGWGGDNALRTTEAAVEFLTKHLLKAAASPEPAGNGK
jgi:acetyl esterase/lipase